LLEVIAACESVTVVHRDLSPSNVLVLPNEGLKVIDFGLCQIEGTTPVTLVDEGVGTQNYMAPECEAGSGAAITSAADLYSAGKLLWSAVSGMLAFAREAPAFGPKSMPKLFPDDPSLWHLQNAFMGTIRHDPAKRWKGAQEAIQGSARIEHRLQAGYPPLELLRTRFCPVCGVGGLADMSNGYLLWPNCRSAGVSALQCNVCGFCFPVDWSILQKSIRQMETAD
jgi:serine/threonine protein kinase